MEAKECRLSNRYEYIIKFSWFTLAYRIMTCIMFMVAMLRGSWDEPFDPGIIGMYTGGLLFCVFFLVASYIGTASKITISDKIIIKRFLSCDYSIGLDRPIYLDEDAILFENYAVELDKIKSGDLPAAFASIPEITLNPLKPEDSKRVARLGWQRIKHTIPFVICILYAVTASIFHITLLPGSWDFTLVPLVVFTIWYLSYWWLEKGQSRTQFKIS